MKQLVEKLISGKIRIDASFYLPRAPGLGPILPAGRISVLKRKLLLAGVDPVSVGFPAVERSVSTPQITTERPRDLFKEFKWKKVQSQLETMPTQIAEARDRRRAAKQEKKKKLPF